MIRLALAAEAQHMLQDELARAVEAAAGDLGIDCSRLSDPRGESDFDVLLMLGYPGFYPSFLRAPRASHRICWFGENLPTRPPSVAQRVMRGLPSARLLDLTHDTLGRLVGHGGRERLLRWRERAAVEREFGHNLRILHRAHAWVDELVVTSGNRAIGAHLAGWTARQVPFGYHAAMAGELLAPESGTRDIDILLLGRDVTARGRRARWLAELRARLPSPESLVIVSGGAYGAERRAMLARARVVVDIPRVPGNSGGIRHLLASAAGAALVTELSGDEWRPYAARCVVEAEPQALAAEVAALLGDEPRRRRLVRASQDLLRTELSMTTCLRRVLEGPAADAR